jgi:tetratricopeptide (TPR) repeat protein
MEANKIIDDIVVSLGFPNESKSRDCLVIFSSKEAHIEIVIDCIDIVLGQEYKYNVIRLDNYLSSGDSQYEEIIGLINNCSIGVVILDGFRPNVLFEFGILKGLNKPCIVLKENNAVIDVIGFYDDIGINLDLVNPKIDMDKHFSDVKDRFYIKYDKNKPKEIREKVKKEMDKLKQQIEDEYMRMLIPNKNLLITEIKKNLQRSFEIYQLKNDEITSDLRTKYDVIMDNIIEIAKDSGIILPDEFFLVNSNFFYRLYDFSSALKWVNFCSEKDIEFFYMKSALLIEMNNYKDAIPVILEAIKIKNNDESLWHRLALAQDHLGDKNANNSFRQGIKFNKDCSLIHYHYGILLFQQNKFNGAYKQFNKANNIEKASYPVYSFWEAKALLKLEKKDDGIEILEKLAKEHPDFADVWFELGRNSGDSVKALGYYDKVIKLEPKHYGAICNKAATLSDLGETQKALRLIRKVDGECKSYNKCNAIHKNIGNMLFKLEKYEEALMELEKCYDSKGETSKYFGFLAVLLVLNNRTQEAFVSIEKAANMDSEDGNCFYNFACALSIKDKINEAIPYLKMAIAIDNKYKDNMTKDKDFENLRNSVNIKEIFGIESINAN